MGVLCSSLCRQKVAEDEERQTVLDGFIIKTSYKEFISTILDNSDCFTDYLDKARFCYYFGVLLKIESWLERNWLKVDITNKKNQFTREKVNEPVFPKLKFLIRKGVPLKLMKDYIQNIFGIASTDTEIDYKFAFKQVAASIEDLIENSPTFGQKMKLEQLLKHHSLNKSGMRVRYGH